MGARSVPGPDEVVAELTHSVHGVAHAHPLVMDSHDHALGALEGNEPVGALLGVQGVLIGAREHVLRARAVHPPGLQR